MYAPDDKETTDAIEAQPGSQDCVFYGLVVGCFDCVVGTSFLILLVVVCTNLLVQTIAKGGGAIGLFVDDLRAFHEKFSKEDGVKVHMEPEAQQW